MHYIYRVTKQAIRSVKVGGEASEVKREKKVCMCYGLAINFMSTMPLCNTFPPFRGAFFKSIVSHLWSQDPMLLNFGVSQNKLWLEG